MKLIRFSLLLYCFCVLSCLSGCNKNKNPDGRLDVNGTITFNGSPISSLGTYTIAFEPIDDPSSGPVSGNINWRTGEYSCTMHDGLKPGKYRVKFVAMAQYEKRTKKPAPPDFEEQDLVKTGYFVSLLPPDFNETNVVEFEAVKGKKNVFDYDLKTDYQPIP